MYLCLSLMVTIPTCNYYVLLYIYPKADLLYMH